MQVQDLNNLSNDIFVKRLEENDAQEEMEKFLASNEKFQALQARLDEIKHEKNRLNQELLEKMREAELKSWKTSKACISRASRTSVCIDPVFKSNVEQRVKAGEEVEGFELKTTEFISFRLNNKK